MWTKISRNALSNFTGTAISLATGFFLMPFTVRHIGATSFGIWMLVNSVVGYMGLLDLGLGPTLVKKAAEHLVREDAEGRRSLNQIVSTIYIIYIALGAIIGIAIAAFALVPQTFFKIPAADMGTFRLVLVIVGLQTATNFPMSIWNGLAGGLQDFHFVNALNIVNNLLRALCTVVLLLSGFGLVSLVLMGFGVSVFSWGANRLWIRHRIPHLKVSISCFDRSRLKELVHFSGAMLIWSIAGYAVHQADRVMLGIFLPVAMLTTYEVGARLSNYSRNVMHSWLSIFMPAASALNAQNDRVLLHRLYMEGTKYLLLSYVAVVIALMGFGRAFVILWMGKTYVQAFWIMLFLLIGNLYQSQNVVAHVMLPGMGRLRVFTRVMSIYPVVTVALGIPMIMKWGTVGMAAALAATMIIMETGFLFYIVRAFDSNFGELLKKIYLPVILSSAPSVAWVLFANRYCPPVNWPMMVVDVGACLVIYAAAMWALAISGQERRALRLHIGDVMRSFRTTETPEVALASESGR